MPLTEPGVPARPATKGPAAGGSAAERPVTGRPEGAPRPAARLARNLTLVDLVVYGLLFIDSTAPMGTFGVLDARSHGATALVVLLATVAMGFTAWSYVRMSEAVPRAGSVFAYARAGLGRTPGFLAGWMVTLDYLFLPALAALFTGITTHALVPAAPVWITTLVTVVLFTALNLAGVRVAARIGWIMLGVDLVLLAAFVAGAVVVLVHTGPVRPWLSPLVGYHGFDTSAVLGTVSVAVLSFLGFDAIVSFAEENSGAPNVVGRALLVCLVATGVLFLAQCYLGSLLMPETPAHLAAHPDEQGAAFYAMLGHALGGWFGGTVTVVRTVTPFFACLVAQSAVARVLYGMARGGQLPAALGRISPRNHTPRTALLVSAAAILVVAVLAALVPDGLGILSSMITVGALTAFLFLHASVVGYFVVRRGIRRASYVVVPAIGAAIVVLTLVTASRIALAIGAAWFVAGLGIALTQARRRPRHDTGARVAG